MRAKATDTKLLPLPELPVAVERFILSSLGPVKREGAVTALRTMLREYARANVAHATAQLQAEIEALRVDVEAWKASHSLLTDTCHHFQALARANDRGESARTKHYVQGVGWCWMEDGEVIEVISEATV